METVKYELGIVSFIDIIGFRALIERCSADEIYNIIQRIRRFTEPDNSSDQIAEESRVFSRSFMESVSDAVVRVRVCGTEYADGAFFQELLDLLHIQMDCIDCGILIRAGVAIGDVHVGLDGKGPVFGPAMVRAYDIESKEAIFPRIVIDEEAYWYFRDDARLRFFQHDLETETNYVNSLLRTGEDGTRFIDYLSASRPEFDGFEYYITFLAKHAELVQENMALTSNSNVRRKYVWLARYHNDVIESLISNGKHMEDALEVASQECDIDPVEFLQRIRIEL